MILIDVTTSYYFRHLNPVGIIRVEQELIRAFRDYAAETGQTSGRDAIVFGVYLPPLDRYMRLSGPDLDRLIRDKTWKVTAPARAEETGLWAARARKAAFLARLVRRARRTGGPYGHERALAELLLTISDNDYLNVRAWLGRASRLVRGLGPRLARLDEINWQVSRRHFDWDAAARFDEGAAIDPAEVRHYVSGGGFWSDDRHKYAYRARAAHGWTVHYLIYDMIPILWRHVTEPTTKETFPAALHWVLWGVDRIWTISETTKLDLLAYVDEAGYPPIDQGHVTPVHLGSDLGADEAPDPAADAATLAKFGLEPGRFALMVGTLEPRKNHDFAYRLWRELHRRHPETAIPLVWVGQPGWSMGPLLQQVGEDYGLPHRAILSLTSVSDAELAALYRACRFTLYPSHYEGWGLPVVESLTYGRPCLAGDAPALVEASRGMADHIGLFDGEAWLARARALMADDAALAEAEARAARFERYRWRDFRRQVAGLFAADIRPAPALPAPEARKVPA